MDAHCHVFGPGDEFPFALLTPKQQTRFLNSSYSHLPKHGPLEPQPALELCADDAAQLGLAEGDMAKVWNRRAELHLPVRVTTRVRPGVVAVAHGWGARVFDPKHDGGFSWDANVNVASNRNKVLSISGAGVEALLTAIGAEGVIYDAQAAKGGDFETELFKRGFKVPCHEGLVLHYQDTQGIHLNRCSRGCVRTSVRTPGTCNNGKFSVRPTGCGCPAFWRVKVGNSGKKYQNPDPGRCLR